MGVEVACGGFPPGDGTCVALASAPSGEQIQQSIPTVVGATYIFSYFLAYGSGVIDFRAEFGDGNVVESLIGDVGFVIPPIERSFLVVATSTTTLVRFTLTHDAQIWLDAVTVMALILPTE